MNLKDLQNDITEATHEIQLLRRRNEILSAKVEMIDLFACVLHTEPSSRGVMCSEDIVGKLEKHLVGIEDEMKPKAA